MAQYNERIFNLVRQYRYNPNLFSEEQVDELQQLADQNNIPFKRKTDDFNLRKTLNNFYMGFMEGFTTIPVAKLSGKEPTTTYESITHSLGHLAGFAPGIMAAPLKAVGGKTLSRVAKGANHWSVPMMFGDAAKAGLEGGFKKKLFGKANIESFEFMKKGASARAIVEQATHLGAASAVSSIWKGPDEIMNAGIHGAIAGGAFGGLGEFRMIGNYLKSKNVKDYRKGEQRLKAAVGASMLGLPTALDGAPIEMVIYQTLLGGYFGYGARPAAEAEGGRFATIELARSEGKYQFHPDTHPEFNTYSKGAKEYIMKEVNQYSKDYYLRNKEKATGYTKDEIQVEVEDFVRKSKGLAEGERPSKADIESEYRKRANNFYESYYKGKGYEYYIHKDVKENLDRASHRMDSTDDVNINVPTSSKKPKRFLDQKQWLEFNKETERLKSEHSKDKEALEDYIDYAEREGLWELPRTKKEWLEINDPEFQKIYKKFLESGYNYNRQIRRSYETSYQVKDIDNNIVDRAPRKNSDHFEGSKNQREYDTAHSREREYGEYLDIKVKPKNQTKSREEILAETKDREEGKNVFAIEERYNPTTGKKEHVILGPFTPEQLGVRGDYNGKILGESRADRPADKLEGTEYILFDTVFINEGTAKTPKFRKAKPLDFKLEKGFKENIKKEFSWEKVFETDMSLDRNGFYIFGGVKDKGTFTIRKYHEDIGRFSKEEIFKALAENNNVSVSDIRQRFEASKQEFFDIYSHHKDKLLLEQLHEKAWKSNVLVEALRNNLYKEGDLSRIYLLETPGYSKDVIDWNKREQIYHDKSMPLKEGTLGGGKFAIFKDVLHEYYKNEKGERVEFDSDTDGTIYFRPKDLKAMMESLGLPSNVDMNKPVMVVKTPEGTMIVKAAGKNAPKELNDYMENNDIKAIIMRSAAKHTGSLGGVNNERFNNFDMDALKRGEWNHTGELFTGEFKDSDIRINLGTFVSPQGALKKQRIVRQLLSNLNNRDAEGVMRLVWDRVFEPNIMGNDILNTKVRDHISGKIKLKELTKFMDKEKLTADDLGVDVIHEIFTKHGNSEVARKLARDILKQNKNGELEDVDTFSPEEYKQYIYRNNRILDIANMSQGQREAGSHSRQFFESVYKKYMLNRLYSPRYKYSSKAWLSPQDPVTSVKYNVKAGTFRLDRGHEKMKVFYKGKEMTLGEAWKKSGRNPNDPDLEMLVIRVPSDSMSGARSLKFAGFTRDKGYSITTNAKDNAYLGGADKDSDSAFIYQNMPKELHRVTKDKAKQWEREGDVLLDSKQEKYDRLFGVDKEAVEKYKTTTSKYSPSLRRRVAETARKGQQGLGSGVIAKQNMIYIADVLMANGGKLTNIPVISQTDGKVYAKIDLELKPGGYEKLIELGREIVNRSADASNYPTMVDYSKFPEILLREAFTGKATRVDKNTGAPYKVEALTYAHIRGTNLGNIGKVMTAINPGRGKDVSWTQMQNIIKNTDVSNRDNFSSFVANKMKELKLTDTIFEEKLFTNHYKLLKDIGTYIENKQGVPDSIIKDINQLYKFQISKSIQKTIEEFERGYYETREGKRIPITYENVRYKLERDLESVALYTSITEKGYEIYRSIDRLPLSKQQKASIVKRILKPIAEEATRIKSVARNQNPNRSQDRNLTHSSSELFDREVLSYKNGRLQLHSAKINNWLKKNGHDIQFSQKLLNDYFDLWLLSPFNINTVKTPFSKFAWQSQSVSNDAIKYFIERHSRIYDQLTEGKIDKVFDVKGEKPKDPEVPKVEPETPKQKVVEKVIKKVMPKTDADYLRSRAIRDKDVAVVEELIKRLDANPHIRDNFNDFFTSFYKEAMGNIDAKDISLIDIKDIKAINEYLKDMDVRFGKLGTKLPKFAWRASPEYMDLFMQNFEEKKFVSTLQPVRTKDGTVIKQVKQYTSTLGLLKDYIHKTNTKMDTLLQQSPEYNKRRYPHLNYGEKKALDINVLVFAKREGRLENSGIEPNAYKDMPEYKRLSKEKFPFEGKKYSLEEIINITDRKYTNDFASFGKKFVYATDKNGKYMTGSELDSKNPDQWREIDVNHKYKKYSDLLVWDRNGRFDIENVVKRLITGVEKGGKVPEVPLETLMRIRYEMKLEAKLGSKASKKSRERYRRKNPFEGIKRFSDKDGNPDAYVPHLNFGRNKKTREQIEVWKKEESQRVYEKAIKEGKSKQEAEDARMLFEYGNFITVERSQRDDLGLSSLNVTGTAKKRKANMPGWDNSHNAIDLYKEGYIRAIYRNMAKIQADIKINEFVKNDKFGKYTKHWKAYLKQYVNDSMGYATTFDKVTMETLREADPKFGKSKLWQINKKRGYYVLSDHNMVNIYDRVEARLKKIGRSMPFSKDIPPRPDAKLKQRNPDLYNVQMQAHVEAITRRIHKFGRLEAKYNLLTLLGHTKIMAGNLFGGTSNTITRAGLKNVTRVNSNKWLMKNIIKDPNGNYRLKLRDGTVVKDKKQLNDWLSENGVIESFITTELDVNADLSNLSGAGIKNVKNFIKELNQKLRRNPDLKDETVLEIAKKYKVEKVLESSAAWFMQTSERKLRKDAFLSHAAEYMEHWGKNGLELSLNDPAVMEAGMRGVEATQFIYHSSFRPAFMRTALGKVFSRFKLFVFNSVRVRKEMLRKASYYGFEPGTKEYEKFKLDFAINMFVMALGTAFAYSIFDTTLPPPYDWMQETGEWLLGDKKERDKAFFAQWPYPIAPLNIVTPPVARIPMSAFSSMINKDWDRFADYQVYTMFPFGRLLRSIDKTYDEPYGTVEGRALQQFLGIPLDKVRSKIDRANVLKAREEMINREMENLV
jgi:hypothetical protein